MINNNNCNKRKKWIRVCNNSPANHFTAANLYETTIYFSRNGLLQDNRLRREQQYGIYEIQIFQLS